MIKFCHIAPTHYTELGIHESEMDMVLAHIARDDDKYAELFAHSSHVKLLDNGAFENGVPMSVEDMINIGHKVRADILVLPDYPYEDWRQGWEDNVMEGIEQYKKEGFLTMFIPQSKKGDASGYMKSLKNALLHPQIDYVGLSILGCPNAFPEIPTHKVREKIIDLSTAYMDPKQLHILGMLDNPLEEIERLAYYSKYINSWDTSLAIWAGLNGLTVGPKHEKLKLAVDFDHPVKDFSVSLVLDNIQAMRDKR